MRLLFTALLVVLLTHSGLCQSRGGGSRDHSPKEFADRVWFGVNLNDLRFGTGIFSFGITPMAAVEVSDAVSFGLMCRVSYYYENLTRQPPKIKFESVDVGPGFFSRLNLFREFFAQVDFERAYLQRAQLDSGGFPIIEDNEVLKDHIEQNYVYVGGGYASGSRVKYTISVHYNILDDIEYVRIPWDVRGGIVWYLR